MFRSLVGVSSLPDKKPAHTAGLPSVTMLYWWASIEYASRARVYDRVCHGERMKFLAENGGGKNHVKNATRVGRVGGN